MPTTTLALRLLAVGALALAAPSFADGLTGREIMERVDSPWYRSAPSRRRSRTCSTKRRGWPTSPTATARSG